MHYGVDYICVDDVVIDVAVTSKARVRVCVFESLSAWEVGCSKGV